MKVLLLEDNGSDVALLRHAIEARAASIDLDVAGSLAEARARLQQDNANYDAFVIDIHLPDGSGLDFVRELRERRDQTPVMVLTGAGDEQGAMAAMRAGADDYRTKKLDFAATVIEALGDLVQHHRSRRRRWQQSLHVLYGEHNHSDIELTRRRLALEAPHIQLSVVDNGHEIMARLPKAGEQADFDVLLLDYRLSGYNALEVLHHIRHRLHIDIPVVIVTGHGDEEIAASAMRLGADDYLTKHPGYLHELPFVLENAYYRWQLEREHEALRISEERFRHMANNIRDVIFRFEFYPTPHFSYINQAVELLMGLTPDQCKSDPSLIWQKLHPEHRQAVMKAIQNRRNLSDEGPLRWILEDGHEVWTAHRISALYDDQGRLIGVDGVVRDVTEQQEQQRLLEEMVAERTRELEQAHAALLQKERQALLGELAGSVGHELGNPLSVIANAVYYLTHVPQITDPTVREYLDIIQAEVNKASAIVKEFVALAKAGIVHPQTTEVADVAPVVVGSMNIPDDVHVEYHLPPDLPPVWMDPQHLDQILTHLIRNALEAMQHGGTLTLDASVDKEAGQVCLTVQDTGAGIASDMLDRIFEPFVSSKAGALGLGLVIARILTEANKGKLTVESGEQGTTFTLCLPVSQA